MNSDFSEDTLVEQPAIAPFNELGDDTANCFYEKFWVSGFRAASTGAGPIWSASSTACH